MLPSCVLGWELYHAHDSNSAFGGRWPVQWLSVRHLGQGGFQYIFDVYANIPVDVPALVATETPALVADPSRDRGSAWSLVHNFALFGSCIPSYHDAVAVHTLG